MSDVSRIVAYLMASITYALAIANLIISFKVLKPRPFTWKNFAGSGSGFIWLHILCVTLPFQGFVTWGIIEVHERFGMPLTWRAPALAVLCLIINVGYVIIYRIELARLGLQRVVSDSDK